MNRANLGRAFQQIASRAPSPHRTRLLGGFVAGVAGAFATTALLRALARRGGRSDDDRVDGAGAESFPASDPPALDVSRPREG